jgi:hypothetical protein
MFRSFLVIIYTHHFRSGVVCARTTSTNRNKRTRIISLLVAALPNIDDIHHQMSFQFLSSMIYENTTGFKHKDNTVSASCDAQGTKTKHLQSGNFSFRCLQTHRCTIDALFRKRIGVFAFINQSSQMFESCHNKTQNKTKLPSQQIVCSLFETTVKLRLLNYGERNSIRVRYVIFQYLKVLHDSIPVVVITNNNNNNNKKAR